MNLRTIMIFPTFENIEIINSIRDKYDPLANLVRPHITIVFPFESDMSNEEVHRFVTIYGTATTSIAGHAFAKFSSQRC